MKKEKNLTDIFYYMLFHYWARFKRYYVTAVQTEIRLKRGTLHGLVSHACYCLAELNSYILNAFD